MDAGDQVAAISAWLPAGWRSGADRHGAWAEHLDPRMRFRPLPAGTYRIGLSDEELDAARRITPEPPLTIGELRPVIEVALDAVLVGEVPVSGAVASRFGVETDATRAGQPAMLTRPEALAIAAAMGCRLPVEAEWESCCRAGSSSLFPWGDTLPPGSELEAWLSWEIDRSDLRRNGFGFGGLFFGEWCAEAFRISHDPGAAILPGAFVVKGGGAQFWPWQDQEWVWCMPAMRMPSTDLFDDRRCAARLVLELGS